VRVPFVDLKAQYASVKSDIDTAIATVIAETAFVGGMHVRKFEEEFAEFCRASYCIGVGNGTDALHLSLKALGIGAGDEVLVPANSFIASSEAVTLSGAKPVFVDCHPDYYTMDVEKAAESITDRTRAIMPVHLYGLPVALDEIALLAEKHRLKLVHDCAQAHAAQYKDKPLSAYPGVFCYSFYPGKNLGAYGDAGAVVLNDEELATRIRMIANHGRLTKYDHEIEGTNSRLDGLQAAILSAKLPHLETWTESRRAVAKRYTENLGSLAEVVPPKSPEMSRHVYHLYVIRVPDRGRLQEYLRERGIATGVHYPVALPNLSAYRSQGHNTEDYPVAGRYQDEIMSLPMYPEMTREMSDHVTAAISDFFAGRC